MLETQPRRRIVAQWKNGWITTTPWCDADHPLITELLWQIDSMEWLRVEAEQAPNEV